ncbi:MAG: hypothetical protein KC561_00245 [Myxococcales bacterium]|nr:hypothetical protein [Myxococcales bacterium]
MQIFPHHELFAEHYLYLPMMGFGFALLPAFEWLSKADPADRGARRAILALVSVTVLFASTFRLWDRSADYANETDFFENAIELAPDNQRAQYALARQYFYVATRDEDPVHYGLTEPLLRQLLSNSDLTDATRLEGLRMMVSLLERTGRPEERDRYLDELLEGFPEDVDGLRRRAASRIERGDFSGAIEDLLSLIEDVDEPPSSGLLEQYISAMNYAGDHDGVLTVADEYGIPSSAACAFVANSAISSHPPLFDRAIDTLMSCADRLGPSEPISGPLYALLGQGGRNQTITEIVDRIPPANRESCRIAMEGLNHERDWAKAVQLADRCATSLGPSGQIEALRVVALIQLREYGQAEAVIDGLQGLGVPDGVIEHLRSRLDRAVQGSEVDP